MPLAEAGPHPGRCWNPWETASIRTVDTARTRLLRVRAWRLRRPKVPRARGCLAHFKVRKVAYPLCRSRPVGEHPTAGREWILTFERYAFPRIGRVPVSEVTSADVLEILASIWHTKAETARRLRQRIRTVLEWAVAMEIRVDNPCDRIGPVLGPQHDVVQHMRALPHREVAAAIRTARASTGTGATRCSTSWPTTTRRATRRSASTITRRPVSLRSWPAAAPSRSVA